MMELIVNRESSVIIDHPLYECVINGKLFKNLTEVIYFDMHIGGMFRGENKDVTLPELLRELANRYEKGNQFELEKWSR